VLAVFVLIFAIYCCYLLWKNRTYSLPDIIPLGVSFIWTLVVFIHNVLLSNVRLELISIYFEICTFLIIAYLITSIYLILK
jgi:hypothetical protein